MMTDFCIVLITTSEFEEAKMLAQGLVSEHLAACVNIIKSVESFYIWEGKINNEQECMLICKTESLRWEELKNWVTNKHSYTVPEIIKIPITEGSSDYLQWIITSLEK